MYLSNRLAMSGTERTEELEKLLYDDARGQIDGRLAHSLGNMPECPTHGDHDVAGAKVAAGW